MTNILTHWNGFVARKRAVPLTTGEIALYYTLFERWNSLGRPEWFCVAAGVLQGNSGMSESAFQRARLGLCRKGYMNHRKGGGNRAGQYHLQDYSSKAPTEDDGQAKGKVTDKVTDKQVGKVTGKPTTLYKEKEKDKEKENPRHTLVGVLGTEEWRDYALMRKNIKRPLGPRATAMALDRLLELAPGDEAAQRRILNQSTFHCWQDLYPLGGRQGAVGQGPPGAGGGRSGKAGPDMDELAARSAKRRREPGWIRGSG